MTYLLLKKLKGLICYLKNLKDLSVTNVKLKGLMDVFSPIFINPTVLYAYEKQ
jgi:hypothetical protein